MSCPFANILGKPNTGAHSIRVFGFSLVDWILTIIGAYFIAKIYTINFCYALLGFFVLGEVLHYLFGANTAFIKMIGLARNCEE